MKERPPYATELDDLYEKYNLDVDPAQGPLRLDKFLCQRLPHVSRHQLQQSIRHGLVLINQQTTKPSYKVRPLDNIQVFVSHPPRDTRILPQRMDLSISYEDPFLLVLSKPAGLVVHPAHANWDGTLLNGLLHHLDNSEGTSPFLVHRIDKDTSGLLLVAKTEEAMCGLAKQFFVHSVERHYWALVWGHPSPSEATINLPLRRSLSDRRRISVSEDPTQGKQAITHYRTLQSYKYVSLLECRLQTGRTHQIRAHLKHIGHPLFNDAAYGGEKPLRGQMTSSYKQFLHNCWELLPHQALHAKSLGFTHPITTQQMYFESDLPPALEAVIQKWARYN